MEVKRIGNLYGEDRGSGFAGNVWDKNGICPTITTMQGGGREPMIIEEVCPTIRAEREGLKVIEESDRQKSITAKMKEDGCIRFYRNDARKSGVSELQLQNADGIAKTITTSGNAKVYEKQIVAMRGRNPEHPTDRTAGIHTEQRLEPAPKGVDNTLTTVQKDNLVLETKIKRIGQISSQGSQCGTAVSDLGLSPTLSAGTHGYANSHVATNYRIRKLTPRECYRLMGFSDEDFDRASGVISNTQLYKTAGNSIIKQVLMAIFSQMNIKGVKPWNEVHDAE